MLQNHHTLNRQVLVTWLLFPGFFLLSIWAAALSPHAVTHIVPALWHVEADPRHLYPNGRMGPNKVGAVRLGRMVGQLASSGQPGSLSGGLSWSDTRKSAADVESIESPVGLSSMDTLLYELNSQDGLLRYALARLFLASLIGLSLLSVFLSLLTRPPRCLRQLAYWLRCSKEGAGNPYQELLNHLGPSIEQRLHECRVIEFLCYIMPLLFVAQGTRYFELFPVTSRGSTGLSLICCGTLGSLPAWFYSTRLHFLPWTHGVRYISTDAGRLSLWLRDTSTFVTLTACGYVILLFSPHVVLYRSKVLAALGLLALFLVIRAGRKQWPGEDIGARFIGSGILPANQAQNQKTAL
eukprot:g1044.t1